MTKHRADAKSDMAMQRKARAFLNKLVRHLKSRRSDKWIESETGQVFVFADQVDLAKTHFTHRRRQPKLREGVIFFLEHPIGAEDNESYGEWIWILRNPDQLPRPPEEVVELAAEYFDIEDPEEAWDFVNPENILESAEAWDNDGFAYEVWEAFAPAGYRTPDGAVILDWREADLEGPIHEEEYYRHYRKYGDPDSSLPPLSQEARSARRPPPPARLVGALHDTVHREVGWARPGRTRKTQKK